MACGFCDARYKIQNRKDTTCNYWWLFAHWICCLSGIAKLNIEQRIMHLMTVHQFQFIATWQFERKKQKEKLDSMVIIAFDATESTISINSKVICFSSSAITNQQHFSNHFGNALMRFSNIQFFSIRSYSILPIDIER